MSKTKTPTGAPKAEGKRSRGNSDASGPDKATPVAETKAPVAETKAPVAEKVLSEKSSSVALRAAFADRNYTKEDVKRSDGASTSIHSGDNVAKELLGLTPNEVMTLVEKELGLDEGTLATKYAHLNGGMRRMNASNRLRGYRRKLAKAEWAAA